MKEKFVIDFELEPADMEKVNELLNLIIEDASREKASDIHFNPVKEGLRLRYRVDGVLRDITFFNPLLYIPLVREIKERASMDTEVLHKPQDGKLKYESEEKYLDIRVSTLPSFFGENVVMRILDKCSVNLDFEKLGFSEKMLKDYKKLLNLPYGFIIVTGPTGSGKTTTGYASLKELADSRVNIMTAEDPVEYIIDNVIQTPINTKEGITFPVVLRHILRQDPDIVYCSEVRDEETAKLLIQLALTGHLTMTSLHTADATGALFRLIDCGVESFLVSNTVLGVISQRLIRTVCSGCKEGYSPPGDIVEILKKENLYRENMLIYRGKGCEKCRNTGYRGRTAVYELLIMDAELKEMLSSGISYSDMVKTVRNKGIESMRTDGFRKALEGITTVEEVLRVCVDKNGLPIF